ncbi:MAG TPA: outer membrane lipoprotein carrier protein LolA, partial [Gemmatimonadales bacterium]|nr:outer membrane lipoprotein carrier protein LolA [Gemmatimonadales bacterium]
LLLALVAVPLPAQAQQDPLAIVRRAGNVDRGLSSLQADFVQVIEDTNLGDTLSRTGRLYQAGQNNFAMRFTDPPDEAIVIDGRYSWFYTPSTTPGQVLRMPLPSGGPVYGYNLLAWLLDRPHERYQSSVVRNDRLEGRAVTVVEMVPTVPDMPFTRAVVWLDKSDGLPRRIEIEETSGQHRTLTLRNLRANVRTGDDTFRFEVPSGIKVIEQS